MPSQKLKIRRQLISLVSCLLIHCFFASMVFSVHAQVQVTRVACVGDSITQGARVDSDRQSYPVRLSEILGNAFEVRNFGIGGATLIREGRPTVWSQVDAIRKYNPHMVIVALGTNDTVEGQRRNWSRIDSFKPDCLDLVHLLLKLPAKPTVFLAGPTPMVLETPGLSKQRLVNLSERLPRLEKLRTVLHQVVDKLNSDRLVWLDLGPVLRSRPELLTQEDGVHPNIQGYKEIALAVSRSIQTRFDQADRTSKVDAWKGYERQHFEIQGRPAWVVIPLKAAPGRPWIWRARFPGFHAEMDHQLVGHGFHIAYVDVAGLFGAPPAMEVGDAFYHEVVKRYQLSTRPVMEGVSRGGLFVYHWAMRHPEKVSAIYCDTPVCDPKSWPGGQGMGVGSARDWNRFLEVNDLTEDSGREYVPPIFKNFHILVQSEIPVMHIISENDTIVPPAENTLRLKSLLESRGHFMDLIRVSEGTAVSGGHHFTHPQPDRVVRFILQNAK